MPFKENMKLKLIGFTPEEWKTDCQKADAIGQRTGTYIRDIAVRGNITHFDMKQFNHLVMSFNRIGYEVNLIAAVANSTKLVFQNDIEDLRKIFEELALFLTAILVLSTFVVKMRLHGLRVKTEEITFDNCRFPYKLRNLLKTNGINKVNDLEQYMFQNWVEMALC